MTQIHFVLKETKANLIPFCFSEANCTTILDTTFRNYHKQKQGVLDRTDKAWFPIVQTARATHLLLLMPYLGHINLQSNNKMHFLFTLRDSVLDSQILVKPELLLLTSVYVFIIIYNCCYYSYYFRLLVFSF
jgi:hypothetical protein